MPENSYKYFINLACEYFPCHKCNDRNSFNCLFCFCPFYNRLDCGGAFKILPNGIKDCSECTFPHDPANYNLIIQKLIKS